MPLRWKKQYKVKCCDGSTKYVHHDVSDAFPLELRESDKKTKARLEVMEQVSGEIEQSHADRIRAGLFSITTTNDTMMLNFRAVYTVYKADPCGQSGYFATETKGLIDEHRRSADLLMRLDVLLNMAQIGTKPSVEIVGQILRIIATLPGFTDSAATSAIAANREAAQAWLEAGQTSNGEGQNL
jgi:hypothetical protein